MALRRSLNYKVLLVLAPLLVATGVLGFLFPGKFPVSTEPAYNAFHIASGAIGVALLIFRYENPVRGFNVGFGLIDIYQAIASFYDLFPERYFKWTPADDVAHLTLGFFLVLVGLYGFSSLRRLNGH